MIPSITLPRMSPSKHRLAVKHTYTITDSNTLAQQQTYITENGKGTALGEALTNLAFLVQRSRSPYTGAQQDAKAVLTCVRVHFFLRSREGLGEYHHLVHDMWQVDGRSSPAGRRFRSKGKLQYRVLPTSRNPLQVLPCLPTDEIHDRHAMRAVALYSTRHWPVCPVLSWFAEDKVDPTLYAAYDRVAWRFIVITCHSGRL